MTGVVDDIMQGNCKASEISALLVALHEKGESVEELAGAAMAMRKHMTPINTKRESLTILAARRSNVWHVQCQYGCGDRGGFSGCVRCQARQQKSTSKTGSADVLKVLGVNIECSVETVEKCLDQLGLCFCYAPLFHPSVKNVTNVRKS